MGKGEIIICSKPEEKHSATSAPDGGSVLPREKEHTEKSPQDEGPNLAKAQKNENPQFAHRRVRSRGAARYSFQDS